MLVQYTTIMAAMQRFQSNPLIYPLQILYYQMVLVSHDLSACENGKGMQLAKILSALLECDKQSFKHGMGLPFLLVSVGSLLYGYIIFYVLVLSYYY